MAVGGKGNDLFLDEVTEVTERLFCWYNKLSPDWLLWLFIYDWIRLFLDELTDRLWSSIFAFHVDPFLVPTVISSLEATPNVSFSHRISSFWPLVSGDNPYKINLSMYARISNLQFCSYTNDIWNNWNSRLDLQSILLNHQSFCHIAYSCKNSLNKSNSHYPKPKVWIATQRRVTFWTVETMDVPSIVAQLIRVALNDQLITFLHNSRGCLLLPEEGCEAKSSVSCTWGRLFVGGTSSGILFLWIYGITPTGY